MLSSVTELVCRSIAFQDELLELRQDFNLPVPWFSSVWSGGSRSFQLAQV